MIFISFPDNTFGEIELEETEFAQLLNYARKGIRITVPVMLEKKIVFLNIVDIRHNPSAKNIDYAQLAKLGSKTTFSR